MASFLSVLKKALVIGLVLAVTTMSVYSALMSSYLYMVPPDMGVCALREYHLGWTSHHNFPLVFQIAIKWFYGLGVFPECQFHPLIPTAWINWLDTPAQTILPFSTFAAMVPIFLLAFTVQCCMACFTACSFVGTPLYLLFQIIRPVLDKLKKFLTFYELTSLIPLLVYAVLEGPHYIGDVLEMVFIQRYDPINITNVVLGLILLVAWFLFLNGNMCRWYQTEKLIPSGLLLVMIYSIGSRPTMFTMVVGLSLWFYSTTIRGRIEKENAAQTIKATFERVTMAFYITEEFVKWINFDATVEERFTQLFHQLADKNTSRQEAKQAVEKVVNKVYKILAFKYHPDRNPSEAATEDMQRLVKLREEMLKLFGKKPIEQWPQKEILQVWLSRVSTVPAGRALDEVARTDEI